MKENYTYKFDRSTGILHKKYFGKITLDDISSSWDKAKEDKLFDYPIKGFLLDYREAEFDIDLKEHHKIAEYYRENIELFGGHKIAIVTESVKDIIIPSLVESKDEGYSSKPFYTMHAAEQWVLS